MKNQEIEIPLSKGKLIMLLIGSIAFVAIGLWFAISPPPIHRGISKSPILIFIIGVVAILFFGFTAFMILKKLQDNKAGLIIDENGITDNASGISAGHIPWKDIKEITTAQVMNQKFVMIIVNNPDEYIGRQTNAIKRKGATINYKSYGSPISISANALKCEFDELKNILQIELEKNKI